MAPYLQCLSGQESIIMTGWFSHVIVSGAAQEGALRKRQAEIYFGLNRELLGLLQHPSWLG